MKKMNKKFVEVKEMRRNKYQKALKRIRNDYLNNHNPDCDILEELVEKATPKKAKPMYIPLVSTPYRCPCCGTLVKNEIEEFNYCHNCGQAIDWRD